MLCNFNNPYENIKFAIKHEYDKQFKKSVIENIYLRKFVMKYRKLYAKRL